MIKDHTDYDTFRTHLLDTLSQELGNGATVRIKDISGSGTAHLEACSINIPGKKLTPVFYPSYFYEKYMSGTSFSEIIENIKDSIRYSSDDGIDYNDVADYSVARGHIIPKLVNMKKNADWIENVAHKSFLDLVVIFIYVIRAEGDELVSFTVSWEQLNDWNQTIDSLYYDSVKNAPALFPLSIQSIDDVLGLSGNVGDKTFYVMTNNRRHYGAACMLYDHALSDFADRLGENFHIIPSSVHEVLIVPDSLGIPADELRDMLCDVNQSIVRDDEILSDRIYYYDRKSDIVGLVDKGLSVMIP